MNLHLDELMLDSKARRKLEDQRRMAFRRAIEDYVEQRRLQSELGDYADLPVLARVCSRFGASRVAA